MTALQAQDLIATLHDLLLAAQLGAVSTALIVIVLSIIYFQLRWRRG